MKKSTRQKSMRYILIFILVTFIISLLPSIFLR
jgi:hypothetical protein